MNGRERISFKELMQLGTLVNFLDFQDIKRILPADFKLYLESRKPNYKLLCSSSMKRKSWFSLLKNTFGQVYLKI